MVSVIMVFICAIFHIKINVTPKQHANIEKRKDDYLKEKEKMKERILYQLMNYEKNKKLLEFIPHIRYLDMAIVFYFLEDGDGLERAAHLLSNQAMEALGFTLDELEQLASKNTPRILPVSIHSIEDMIEELMEDVLEDFELLEEEFLTPVPMHVLTNTKKLFGASVLLYPQVLWSLGQSLQDDFYVLPSSIHECIIVPASAIKPKELLKEIVQDINREQVPQGEILSNNVFFYRRKSNSLSL